MCRGNVAVAELTEALSTLADAQQAEVDFREAAPALDSTSNVVSTNSIDVEAGEASAQDIKDYYADVAASVGHSSNVNVTGFASKTDAVQDSYIAAYETSLSADVDAAKVDLPSNMTSLLETLESRQEAVVDKLVADDTQADNLTAEVAAFDSANGTNSVSFVEYDAGVKDEPAADEILIISESDYDASANYSNGYVMVDGVIYAGEDGSGTEVALKDLTEADRSSQLSAAYEAKEASASAVTSAKAALENAIEDVVLAENDALELASGEDVTNFVTYTPGDKDKADVVVDLTQSVGVYQNQEDKTEETAQAEVQTLSITAETNDDGDEGLDVTYGNDDSTGTATVSVDLSGVDVTDATAIASAVASQLNGDATFAGLADASASGADVTITYNGTLEGTDVGTTVSAAATGTTDNLAGAGSETTAGATVTGTATTVDAADTDALLDALAAQEDFAELVAQFEEARDLNTELSGLEDSIEDATNALENDPENVEEPGLGVTLTAFDGTDASADSDVFLFEDKEGTTVEIADFGASGEDQIFFGDGYSLVEITGDEGINGNEGDAGAMEILWEQNGSDLNLYVEAETFGGNSAGTADVTQITLTGVSAEDITFEGGFLSAGEVA